MRAKFTAQGIPVDSVSISDPQFDAVNNMQMGLAVFPSGKLQFGSTDISKLSFLLSNQTYKTPQHLGPYFFIGLPYPLPDGKMIYPLRNFLWSIYDYFCLKKLYWHEASPVLYNVVKNKR